MPEEHLSTLLRRLHEELDRSEAVDEPTERLLRRVMDDIEHVLRRDEPTPPGEEHHSLVQRLRKATWQIEQTHPAVTAAVGRLADALGQTFR